MLHLGKSEVKRVTNDLQSDEEQRSRDAVVHRPSTEYTPTKCVGSAWTGERAFPASECNAIFGEPVCDDISQRTRRVERAAAETATGFKKERRLGGPCSHSRVEKQDGYGRNNAGPNAHTPHQATSLWGTSAIAVFLPPGHPASRH